MDFNKTDKKEPSYLQSMMISNIKTFIPIFLCSAGLLLAGCGGDNGNSTGPDPDPDPDPNEPNTGYTYIQQDIFNQSCALSGCHNSATQQNGVNLSSYEAAMSSVGSQYGTEIIDPGNPGSSPIVDKISNDSPEFGVRMPESGAPLSSADIDSIVTWIEDGAPDN